MRGAKLLLGVQAALRNLNPDEVRKAAEQDVSIAIGAPGEDSFAEIAEVLVGPGVTAVRRKFALQAVEPAGQASAAPISIYDASLPHPEGAFLYVPGQGAELVKEILARHPELQLALARRFPAFRQCVVSDIIRNVSKENALFALATSVPSIVPLLSLPLAVGEFASDSAFLTMNQIRMAFLMAAASGKPVGFRDQKKEIASIIASAFGWRALARQVVGKIPMGGGIVPKAAIAFAATFVVGSSLDRLYRMGYGYTQSEREAAYKEAFERGKQIASTMLDAYRGRRAGSLQ